MSKPRLGDPIDVAERASATRIANEIGALISDRYRFLADILECEPDDLDTQAKGLASGLIELAVRLGVSPAHASVKGASEVAIVLRLREALTLGEHMAESERSTDWYEWLLQVVPTSTDDPVSE